MTGLAVAGLSLGTALNPLNSSMIAVALVVLREDFGLDVATVTWVITAFYLTSAAGQPLMGRLADRFGPRRLFMLGMALVAVTCALAPSRRTSRCCAWRGPFMALGTATAYPSAVVMVGALARAGEREVHPAAGPDPDGEHVGGGRRARGGRPAGGPGGLAGPVPDQRPAGRWLAILVVRRFAPADGARERGRGRSWCGTRTCPGSWPSSVPWCW